MWTVRSLDKEEGEVVVGEVDLGHVHVHGVRRHEGQGEAHDDAPAGTLLPTAEKREAVLPD